MAKTREMRRREAAERYDKLSFTDDYLFCKILEKNPDITKSILEMILGFKIKEIRVQQQKPIEPTAEGKGIRLDVYAEDEERDVYDLEMQTVTKKELPKRARYYQGMLDLNMIERGASYSELRKSFVIFLCLTDPFDRGQIVYTISNLCKECSDMEYKDDAYKIFINASGTRGEVSKDMKAFLALLRGEYIETPLTKKIQEEVEAARTHDKWRSDYMTLYMIRQEEHEAGLEEGREEGLAKGRAEAFRRIIDFMRRQGKSPEKIAEDSGLSLEEVLEVINA